MSKISFLSNTVTKPFDRYFEAHECSHFEVNNITQVLSGKVDADYLVLLIDISYFAFDGFLNDKSNEIFDELFGLLEFFRKNNSTKVIVSNIAGTYLDINTALNIEEHQKLLNLNCKINRFAEISDVAILNVYHLISLHGYQNFINTKNGFLFQVPWTKLAYTVLSTSINENLQLFQTTRKKVLILDADNTLWGGIIGENGINNIDIDENYPGKIFRNFQQQLKYLQNSGLLLTIVSKNNFHDIRKVFKTKDMPLKWDDFIVKKINWGPKSQNINELMNELNIGMDSAIFLDDNSFELAEVESAINIDTIKISKNNPIENLKIFDCLISTKTLTITEEDKKKNHQYQTQKKRQKDKSDFKSIDDYLSSIDMVVDMSINNKGKVKRIAQLINKTNQFNLTTKRYSESEVVVLMERHSIFSFNLVDKFGDLGLVAVVILVNNNIDSFLISCRALGRNLEYKILHLIAKNTEGELISSYVKTEKNTQVNSFYNKFSTVTEPQASKTSYHLSRINMIDISYITEKE